MSKSKTYALVGEPNVGKTTVINLATGSHLKTGNLPGITVSKKEISVIKNDINYNLIDIPGLYSLDSQTNEEQVAVQYLNKKEYDGIVYILDARKLERGLKFLKELKGLTNNITVLVSFYDVLRYKNTELDLNLLSKEIGVKVLATSDPKVKRNLFSIIEENEGKELSNFNPSDLAKKVMSSAIKTQGALTKFLDKILLNKFTGLPILLLVMYAVFNLTYTIGGLPMEWIENGFVFVNGGLESTLGTSIFAKAIYEGIMPGIEAVLLFLPNILILFFLISILEETGYMSRMSFILDGIFRLFGLNGKSIIPLMSGTGCSISAYMSARIISNKTERLITMMLISFMPCGAKLVVFVLMFGVFFGENADTALFCLYTFSIVFCLVAAKVLRLTMFRKETDTEIFIAEVPEYNIPSFVKGLAFAWDKACSYLKNAGLFIGTVAVAIWFFSSFSFTMKQVDNMDDSILAKTSRVVQPIFAPLGMDYKMTASLVTGLLAKEVALSTMVVLYSKDADPEDEDTLKTIIRNNMPYNVAIPYLVFMFFYLPCLAATKTFSVEARTKGATLKLIGLTSALAYGGALLTRLVLLV